MNNLISIKMRWNLKCSRQMWNYSTNAPWRSSYRIFCSRDDRNTLSSPVP